MMSTNSRQNKTEIQQLRKELEDFTYIVSHDLNAPIRHVLQFSMLLEQRLSDREILSQEEQQFLEIICGAANRARNMINALLTLSRSTNTELNVQPLALKDLFERIRSELAETYPDREIFIDYNEFSKTIDADSSQLQTALTAIFDNSIRFTPDNLPVKIVIQISELDGYAQLDISDGGPGIPLNLAERVFQCFYQTDRDPEDSEHLGVGLTIARRIARRHSGNLTMEKSDKENSPDCVWPRLRLPLELSIEQET